MGSFVPVAFQALQAFQAVNTVVSSFDNSRARAQSGLALEQLQARQAQEYREAQEKAVLEKDRINANAAEAERLRKNALKRAVARQRAAFGASGVQAGNGSSEAVLLGLFDESEEEKKSREKMDRLRNLSLDQGLSTLRSANTLTRTHLAQRQKLANNLSSLETIDRLYSLFG
jgi:hypothetical protein